jgi:hypothetical protein
VRRSKELGRGQVGEDAEKYAPANEVIHEAQVELASAHGGQTEG